MPQRSTSHQPSLVRADHASRRDPPPTSAPPPPGARNRRYRHASPLSRAQAQPLLKSRAGTSARRQSISRRRRTILFIPMAVPTFACLALLRRVACCIGKARKKLCSWWVSRLSGTCAVLIRWPHVDLIISTGNQ
jgi:hypothetical protein